MPQTEAPPITFNGDSLSIKFDRFDQPAYRLFLKCKRLPESVVTFDPAVESYTISAPARFAEEYLGVPRPARTAATLPFIPELIDDQREVLETALDAKRFATWAQCGWGKTVFGLEFARHVAQRTNGGRVLIVTLNEIVQGWIDECEAFYGPARRRRKKDRMTLRRLSSRAEMRIWMKDGEPGSIGITNYEKWNPTSLADQVVNEARHLSGVILDESNRLAASGGKQKWALIKSCRGIEYKLSLTATPAPNDIMEFASQASFLEKMRTDNEIIWTYFTRDPKTHRWTVKPHARAAFFEFMSSWSIYINDPKRYGWRSTLPDVPRPEYHTVEVKPTAEQMEHLRLLTAEQQTGQMDLFGNSNDTNAIQRVKLSQIAKGFRYRGDGSTDGGRRTFDRIPSAKPGVVCDLIRQQVATGQPGIIWTVFDAETRILSEMLQGIGVSGVDVLTGATPKRFRPEIIAKFRRGDSPALMSRARLLGYGQNFQVAKWMIFSGWNDSFVDLYQSVRRAYRHGQTDAVRVYFPFIRELEGDTFDNIQRKEREFERSIEEQEEMYIAAKQGLRSGRKVG